MADNSQKRALSRRQFLRMGAVAATGIIAVACSSGQQQSTQSVPASGGTAPTATTGSGAGAASPTAATGAGGASPTATTAGGAAAPTATTAAGGAAGGAAATATGGPTAVPTVAVGNYGTGGQPVVLWTGLSGADGATFAQMLQMYTQKNSGKAVRSEVYVWDVLYQKLPTATAAGTPPDVTVFHDTEIPQFTAQGILQPLDDIMYSTGLIPANDFAPNVIGALTIDNQKMCVPFDNHGWVCYINKKVIQDAGQDPANLPKNGKDFVDWANKVTTDDSGKHPGESGYNPDKVKIWAHTFSWIRFTMPSTFYQYGGGFISDDKKKAILNSAESTAAVQYWYDLMYKYKSVAPAVPGVTSDYDMYKTNSLAVMWDGSWSLGYFKDNPDLVPLTQAEWLNSLSPDGKQANKIGIHNFSIPVGVSQDGVKRAQDLIKWMSDNSDFWANSGQVPARLSKRQAATVQNNWETKVAADEFSHIGRPDPGHKAYTEIQTTWETAVGAALANTQPLKQALDQGTQQIQAILDRP